MKLIVPVFILLLSGCSGEPEKKPAPSWNNEQSTKFNKELAQQENIDIKLFLARHDNWKAEETGSGLRYIEFKEGSGPLASTGKEAKVAFTAALLDGTVCYKTPDDEVEIFLIDKSEVETGIQEGIKKMKAGGKAKLIIPSHLAHGLIGDLDKIPPLATLVVDIELIELK